MRPSTEPEFVRHNPGIFDSRLARTALYSAAMPACVATVFHFLTSCLTRSANCRARRDGEEPCLRERRHLGLP
jgi:hypothetical protein